MSRFEDPSARSTQRQVPLRIASFELTVDPKVHVAIRGSNPTTLDGLKIGDVIDIDGKASAPYRVAIDEMELRPDKARSNSFKLEALLEKVDLQDRELTLGRVKIEVEEDAKFVGFEGNVSIPSTRLSRDLLRGSALDDEHRWSLASELTALRLGARDSSGTKIENPTIHQGIRAQLRDLLTRGPALDTSEHTLDDATKAALRETGYLR